MTESREMACAISNVSMDNRIDRLALKSNVGAPMKRRRSSSSDSSSSSSSSPSESELRPAMKRKRSMSKDRVSYSHRVDNDVEELIQAASNDQTAKGEKTGDSLEAQDDLLNDIANEFNADETLCALVETQLADIVNKRWSEKMSNTKLKDKLDKS